MSASPVETSLPSRGHRPSANPKKQILQKSPGRMSSSPVETSLPSRGHRPSVTPKRQILEKSRLPSSPCIETSCAVPLATTLTREQDIKKQQKTRTSTTRKLAHSPGPVTNLFHIIGSSFDVLNNENNQFPQYQDVSFQPDEVVGEFGYNNTSTCSTSSFPVQPLIVNRLLPGVTL
ncbi:uncharacterized protein LOC128172743 isoform X2 [Crassostrea angulata]|uniref:uncharacterized protein LOC128172743 isoform X2 n=1 Tax=Magallana angulata TaxID=2784310 RepID=UPI0022B1B306|nr:uncharacterized protein LOC128172743 isoform X2 [Crassostrea angulata]